jgi:hypothetical protein
MDMIAARARPKRPWVILFVAVLCVSGLSAVLLRNLSHPKPLTVAEAQARLNSTRNNLVTAMRVSSRAQALSQGLAGTSSPITRAVQSSGDALVQKLRRDTMIADVESKLAANAQAIVQAADSCLQSYPDEERAQDALAALNLSGFKQVRIRSAGQSPSGTGQSLYEVMVPHDSVDTAKAVLLNSNICEVTKFDAVAGAFQAIHTLEARGIRATVRPAKVSGSADTQARAYRVIVFSADAKSARNILGQVAR